MSAILKEQGLQQTAICNDVSCAVEMGQILGVNELITGNIEKLGNTYILSLKLIDIETGKIINIATQKHNGKIEDLIDVAETTTIILFDKKNTNVVTNVSSFKKTNQATTKQTNQATTKQNSKQNKLIKNANKKSSCFRNGCITVITIVVLAAIL